MTFARGDKLFPATRLAKKTNFRIARHSGAMCFLIG
jgi:hypothetical protein